MVCVCAILFAIDAARPVNAFMTGYFVFWSSATGVGLGAMVLSKVIFSVFE